MHKHFIATTLLVLFFLIPIGSHLSAQNIQQIGFVNSNDLLERMPEKTLASDSLNILNKEYKDELKIMQTEYNKKYADFISYQNSMGDNIKLRRMQELYELEKHINDFLKLAQNDVQNKEQELLNPLRAKVKDAIYQVGIERGLVCIYDLANPGIVFVTPDAIDITPDVEKKLNIK